MVYDPLKDQYICHNGKKLSFISTTIRESKSDYEATVKMYQGESCDGCQYKSKCTKAKGNKRIEVLRIVIEKREVFLPNITSKKGIILRMNR